MDNAAHVQGAGGRGVAGGQSAGAHEDHEDRRGEGRGDAGNREGKAYPRKTGRGTEELGRRVAAGFRFANQHYARDAQEEAPKLHEGFVPSHRFRNGFVRVVHGRVVAEPALNAQVHGVVVHLDIATRKQDDFVET